MLQTILVSLIQLQILIQSTIVQFMPMTHTIKLEVPQEELACKCVSTRQIVQSWCRPSSLDH
jgi:hypothetical protein